LTVIKTFTREPSSEAQTIQKKKAIIDELKQEGVEFVEADYSDIESLKKALKGVTVVVSALSREVLYQDQLNLIEAAKAVGTITRFLPSEFGMDGPPDDNLTGNYDDPMKMFASKLAIRKALVAAGIPYTLVITGLFLEFIFNPVNDIFIDTKTLTVIGDGNWRFPAIHSEDIAKYLPRVVLDQNLVNKKAYLVGDSIQYNEIVKLLEESFKTPFTKHHISHEELQARIESEQGFPKFKLILQYFLSSGSWDLDLAKPRTNDPNDELYSDIIPLSIKKYVKTTFGK